MSIKTIRYARGATGPNLELWIYGDDGDLINLGVGFDLSLRIGNRGVPALLEKTTGLTGAAGSGNENGGGVPNLVVQWTGTELDIDPGEYELQINADSGSGTAPRYFFYDFEITDIVLAPV